MWGKIESCLHYCSARSEVLCYNKVVRNQYFFRNIMKNKRRMVYFVEEFLANVIKEMSRKAIVGEKKVEKKSSSAVKDV